MMLAMFLPTTSALPHHLFQSPTNGGPVLLWINESTGEFMSVTFCVKRFIKVMINTVDGRHPANQLRLVDSPMIYMILYIASGAGFLPSTVCVDHFTNKCKMLAIPHLRGQRPQNTWAFENVEPR